MARDIFKVANNKINWIDELLTNYKATGKGRNAELKAHLWARNTSIRMSNLAGSSEDPLLYYRDMVLDSFRSDVLPDEYMITKRRETISQKARIRAKNRVAITQTEIKQQLEATGSISAIEKPQAIKPEVVAQQVQQKPPVTAKLRDTLTKIEQTKPPIVSTPDISQISRREKIHASGESALKTNKDVLPAGRKSKIPMGRMRAGNVYNIGPFPFPYEVNTVTDKDGVKHILKKQVTNANFKKHQVHKFNTFQILKEAIRTQKDAMTPKSLLAQDIDKVFSKTKAFLSKPWSKRVIGIGLTITALNMVSAGLNRIYKPKDERAIPNEYERGYDIIKQHLTDFGSPVNISKAAQKVIMPYYSTVRKAVYTSTRSVTDSNLSLALSKNAIQHTRY